MWGRQSAIFVILVERIWAKFAARVLKM